jgi:monofunctional biosynthetic peptidoglycan transglycosylase
MPRAAQPQHKRATSQQRAFHVPGSRGLGTPRACWAGFSWSALLLQVWFAGRIAFMAVVDPQSTAFQRSEAWRLWQEDGGWQRWRQRWVPDEQISPHLKRAVIAAEDAGFVEHFGVDWEAVQAARERNERRLAQAQRRASGGHVRPARLAGGSTITQQLAKNLLLSGERTLWRKGQELLLAWMLEATLDKRRILEIYLNAVEWGDGIFGAEAAAQHYFRKPRRPPDAGRGSPTGGAAARPKALRGAARFRLSREPHANHSGAHGRRSSALMAGRPAKIAPCAFLVSTLA